MNKKNVYFVACYDSPKGGSSRTWEFSKGLREEGHSVTFITSNYNHLMPRKKAIKFFFYEEENIDGIRVIWVNSIRFGSNIYLRFLHMVFYSFSSFFVALIYVKKNGVTIGTSVPLPLSLFSLLASKIKRSKYIFEIRDVWPEELIDLGSIKRGSFIAKALRFMEKILCIKSDVIISALPNVSQHLREIKKDLKFHVIPNPVDSSLEFSNYLGGNSDELNILYLGGSGQAISIETIVDAFFLLPEEKNIRITFVGPSRIIDDYLLKIKKFKSNKFKSIGLVPKNEIPKFINDADLLVNSIKDTDQLKFGINSNKLLEYCASGRVVLLAAKVKNDPISISKNGLVIEPEDPKKMSEAFLTVLAMSPEKRKQMGTKGKDFSTRQTAEILSNNYSKVIQDI